MSEKVRLYRYFSAAQLDRKFVRNSMALLPRNRGKQTAEKIERMERMLELIDEERNLRLGKAT